MGGDLQATPWEGYTRSHYPSLSKLCVDSDLRHNTPTTILSFIPARITLDHWFCRRPTPTKHHPADNINTSTYTPHHGDHKALILELMQIRQALKSELIKNNKNPTIRSHPPFILPIPQHPVGIYQLGKATITNTIRHTRKSLSSLLHKHMKYKSQTYYAADQVMTLIHELHVDIAAGIWPMQPPKPETPIQTSQRPPISRAGLWQIGRLAIFRNECNILTKHHPYTSDIHDHNPIQIHTQIHTLTP
jgi:hypothetical protein